MKGIVFNLAEEVLTRAHGADAWDAVIAAASVEGSYTALGSYPDTDLTQLVGAAGRLLGVDEQSILCSVGEGAMPMLAERYPHFFTPHLDAISFILTLNDIIHPEVLKLYPGASVPTFAFERPRPDLLLLGYDSPRRLCALAEGFVLGAARHYGQAVTVDHQECVRQSDPACLLSCDFGDVGD